MNRHKLRDIVDFVRRQGSLPTDQFGQILGPDDLLMWFGLDACLSRYEQARVKMELAALAEAQTAVDRIKMAEQLRSDV